MIRIISQAKKWHFLSGVQEKRLLYVYISDASMVNANASSLMVYLPHDTMCRLWFVSVAFPAF